MISKLFLFVFFRAILISEVFLVVIFTFTTSEESFMYPGKQIYIQVLMRYPGMEVSVLGIQVTRYPDT